MILGVICFAQFLQNERLTKALMTPQQRAASAPPPKAKEPEVSEKPAVAFYHGVGGTQVSGITVGDKN